MNLTFADVSTPLLNMIQQELPAEAMVNPQGAEVGKKMFADKLNKTLASVDQPGNETAVPDVMEKTTDQIENTAGIISEKLDGKKGQQFVSALKTIFMMLSKGRIEDVSLDASGLETLKKMLLKAGFNQEDVTDLLTRLSEELEEGELSLDKVFEQLFDLPFEAREMADPEIFLESSQAPFIESILVSLGIPAQTIQEILTEADKGDQGISLDVVIDKLQKIQKTDFYSGNSHTVSKSGSPIEQLS